MNPEGQPGQLPPTQDQPQGVPPVNPNWQQQAPQPIQQPVNPLPQQPAPLPPVETVQQPYTLPSGADIHSSEYSIDYLNKIAPKEQRTVNRFAVLGLIGAGIIAAIVAVVVIASSGGPDVNQQLIPISERIATLQSVTSAEQKYLAEAQISEANAALSSSLVSMNTDLTSILKARQLKGDAKSNSAKSEKLYATALKKTLDDSYQRGTLDRTYTTQMTYELSVLKNKIVQLKQNTNSKQLLLFCNTSLDNINPILTSYASFDATKS